MYAKFWKRFFDFFIALFALILLLPLLIILAVVGAIAMGGNPFFVQKRPGKNEKIFWLIKFRTMSNKKGKDGKLLPDEDRLTGYGKILRRLSIDELPELINILIGDMSIVGPRPLLVKYLPLYNQEQKKRHNVSPGLTGYAQAYGRNSLTWKEKFEKDIYYVENISFWLDVRIFFKTICVVLKRDGISAEGSATMQEFLGNNSKDDVDAQEVDR